MRNHHVTYRCAKEDYESLSALAAALGVPKSEAIRRAVLMAESWMKEGRNDKGR